MVPLFESDDFTSLSVLTRFVLFEKQKEANFEMEKVDMGEKKFFLCPFQKYCEHDVNLVFVCKVTIIVFYLVEVVKLRTHWHVSTTAFCKWRRLAHLKLLQFI